MSLTGVALLPQASTLKQIVEFRREHASDIAGPVLGMERNLPHTSILQCPFDETALTPGLLAELNARWSEILDGLVPAAELGQVYYQPTGWMFIDIPAPSWIRAVQRAFLNLMDRFIDRSAIACKTDYTGYTEAEKANYERFGYRYVGTSFRPHITLGRTTGRCAQEISPHVVASFDKQLAGQRFRYERIAFYRAGEFGALAEVIAEADQSGHGIEEEADGRAR